MGGTAFFLTIKSFTSGANNWVVIPSLSICLYIVSFILVNFILSLKSVHPQNLALICLLAFNLLMLAPAFGRCDPSHVLYNGLGVFICAWAFLAYLNNKYFKLYSLLFYVVFVVAMNISGLLSYKESIGIVIMKKFKESPAIVKLVTKTAFLLDKNMANKIGKFMQKEESKTDTNSLRQYTKIALPFYVDQDIYLYLSAKHIYAPEFYTDILNLGTKKQILDKLTALQDENHKYMVIPEKYFDLNRLYSKSEKEEKDFISSLFLFPFYYKKINDSRRMLEPIYKYIIDNYRQVKIVKGGYVLVQRKEKPNQVMNSSKLFRFW